MAAITWSDALSVKIGSIDTQHQKLIALVNEFYDNISKRNNEENILVLIHGMKKYALFHFNTEERYMQRFNYPEYEQHCAEHRLFIDKVSAIEDKLQKRVKVISFEVTNYLKDWIKTHIRVTDKKYSDFFIRNGVT